MSKLTMHRIAMCLVFISMALEWVLVKLSIEFCLVLYFQIENFQDLEARTNKIHVIISYKAISEQSSDPKHEFRRHFSTCIRNKS